MEAKIIFEDEQILVLDKPAGMIVNRSDTTKGETTLQDFVEKHLNIPTPKPQAKTEVQDGDYAAQTEQNFISRSGIVHRLDKETSGIILVAKTLGAFMNLQAQFKERKVQKTYLALTHGKIEPEAGEINVAVGRLPWNRKRFGVLSGGREAITRYRVISNFKFQISNSQEDLSLVELSPKTGRTHQIRVHLQYIKHPIFADPLYAGRKTSRNDRKFLPRVFLHASKISFFHPASGELLSLESPLPDELKNFLSALKS
ncbi:MAG: RluA family pseudouridine synthase [Candidatus Levybacteria bacterium]|nr:RluA family pseudouridine synthase [Candidatus Levybacteria bacterium]